MDCRSPTRLRIPGCVALLVSAALLLVAAPAQQQARAHNAEEPPFLPALLYALCDDPNAKACVLPVDVALDLLLTVAQDLLVRQPACRQDLGVKVSRLFQPQDGVGAAAVVLAIDPDSSALARLGFSAAEMDAALPRIGCASRWLADQDRYGDLPPGFRIRLEALERVLAAFDDLAAGRVLLERVVAAVPDLDKLSQRIGEASAWAEDRASITAGLVSLVCTGCGSEDSLKPSPMRRAAMAAWVLSALGTGPLPPSYLASRPGRGAIRMRVSWDIGFDTALTMSWIVRRLRAVELDLEIVEDRQLDRKSRSRPVPPMHGDGVLRLLEHLRRAVVERNQFMRDQEVVDQLVARCRERPWACASCDGWAVHGLAWKASVGADGGTSFALSVTLDHSDLGIVPLR